MLKEKLKPILKPIKKRLQIQQQSLLGTAVRPINFLTAYTRSSISMFAPPEIRNATLDPRAEELRRVGFVSLPGIYDPKLIRSIGDQFNRLIEDERYSKKHCFTRTIKDDVMVEHVPQVFELLRNKELQSVLHSLFKSYFTLTYLSSTRLYPIPEGSATKEDLLSANWHCDDHTVDLVHIVVYLHDVTDKHGPTHFLTRQRTAELMRKGFYNRFDYGLPMEEVEHPEHVKKLTGPCGTAHLAISPLVLHRAGVPAPGFIRDSLFFSVRPSFEPKQVRDLSPIKKGTYQFLHWLSEDRRNSGSKVFKGKDIIY